MEGYKKQIFAMASAFVLNKRANEFHAQKHCLYLAALRFSPTSDIVAQRFASAHASEFLDFLD